MTLRRSRAFTLIELLVVMAIMGIMMMITVGAFEHWGRGTGMRTSVLNLRSGLSFARQYAITHRARTFFIYTNGLDAAGIISGYYLVATNQTGTGLIGTTNFIANGLNFAASNWVEFALDGSCAKTGVGATPWPTTSGYVARDIVLQEVLRNGNPRPNGLAVTTIVYRLTGRVKSKAWVED